MGYSNEHGKECKGQTVYCFLSVSGNTINFSAPKMDEKADPQESLMSMMKQMYDDGDDEMKRTIRKSWHESQSKKRQPGGGGDDDFGGMGDF